MGLRGRIRHLERNAREEMIEIPQKDGTVARFPKSASMEAFANLVGRMGAGEDAPARASAVGGGPQLLGA